MKETDIAVVGAGTAGMTAAIYAVRAGFRVSMFEGYMPGGQIVNTGEVENYPATGRISGFDYSTALLGQAKEAGAQYVAREVLSVKRISGGFELETAKEQYFAKALIIATGAKNRELGVEGEKRLTGRGISYCATCDGALYRGREVAVVGGGNTAAADAEELSRLCSKVYLIHRRATFRAQQADIDKLRAAGNVEFLTDCVIREIKGEDKLSSVVVENVKDGSVRELKTEGLFVAVGQTPTTALFDGLVERDPAGYIKAGEDCVAAEGIFVAGDCRTKKIRQLVTAAADGAVAALAAAEYLGASSAVR